MSVLLCYCFTTFINLSVASLKSSVEDSTMFLSTVLINLTRLFKLERNL